MKSIALIILLAVVISGCAPAVSTPSEGDIQTAIAKTNEAQNQTNSSLNSTSTFQPAIIPTKQIKPTSTSQPTSKPTNTRVPTQTPNPNLFTPGTYLVGTEIKPGIYRGKEDYCYWERLKDLSGSFDAIIANGGPEGQFYVEVSESDLAFKIECQIIFLESLPDPLADMPKRIEPGMYLVGRDIKPGTYKGNEEYCYWERLSGVDGSFDSIITNGGPEGQFYVEVQETDFAFKTGCPLDFVE